MKKIFFVLAAGITLISCTETDSKSAGSNNAAPTNSSVTSVESNAPNTSNVQASPTETQAVTKIEWLDGTERDFGKIKEGEKLDVTFRFKNTGDKPLIVSDVKAGCGCTVAEKPSKPFAPGETGEIKASFDSHNQGTGAKSKNVNVFANTDPQMTSLVFKVEVKAKS